MRAAVACLALLFVPGVSFGYTLRLVTPSGSKTAVVEVGGIDADNLEKLGRAAWESEQWNKLLSVKPLRGTALEQQQRPAMLGSCRVSKDGLLFEPRFPLQPGISYQAVFDPAVLPAPVAAVVVKATVEIPAVVREASTVVSRIFPTREQLPENLLKFYIHFSAPMSQGEVYRHFQLLDEKGKPIAWPFLELGEELWNPDGTRFTLFFDPGRIKKGLKPREDLGPALEQGKKYTFVIDSAWTDANGQPLKASYRKTFSVGKAVDKCVPMEQWEIEPPHAGTRQSLEVVLPAPMDSALLRRMVWVLDGNGKKVAGEISLAREETVWRFTPSQPWQKGGYQLTADSRLEDLAGNSLGKPFEVDVLRPGGREIQPEIFQRSFTVKATRGD
jgi:hypothetical protein